MPQMVADLFERQAIGNKPGSTGVTQRVRPSMGDVDSKRNELAVDDIVNGARRDRTPRRLQPDKYFRTWSMRANGVDVTRQRFGYGGQKRVDLRLSPLQTKYPQRTSAPIDLVKPQRRDFAAAQSVDCKQHQDRTITNVSGCVRPGVRQIRLTSFQPGA